MDTLRVFWSTLIARLASRRRLTLVVGSAALILLLLTTILLTLAQPSAPSHPTRANQATQTSTATATDTAIATATATTTPTLTPHVKSQPVTPVQAPPPPPVPTQPAVTPTIVFCPTPTPLPAPSPTPSPTNTPVPTATATPTSTSTLTPGVTPSAVSSARSVIIMQACTPCPYYKGNNPSKAAIQAALYAAADTYHLPRNLLLAVAWQESRWHEDVLSCDGGIGLMQLQYYTWPWLNSVSVPACNLTTTNDDPNTLQGNANLGAKFLAWLSCFYSYWGNNGGSSLSSPGQYTIDWYYQQAHLQYPDTKNADGSLNPKSLCAAVFNDPTHPEYTNLPSTTAQPWSCPYSATAGDGTLLDFTLSAYNEGPGYTDKYGIQNWWYVDGVEGYIPQFASGALPG